MHRKTLTEVIGLIKVLYGKKGTGKSARIVALANDCCRIDPGHCVFIDKDCDHMYELIRDIRFINASEYLIDGPKMFTGFISGIASQDFDLQAIYINSFMKLVRPPLVELEEMFAFFERFTDSLNVDLVIAVSSEGVDGDTPEFIKKYII